MVGKRSKPDTLNDCAVYVGSPLWLLATVIVRKMYETGAAGNSVPDPKVYVRGAHSYTQTRRRSKKRLQRECKGYVRFAANAVKRILEQLHMDCPYGAVLGDVPKEDSHILACLTQVANCQPAQALMYLHAGIQVVDMKVWNAVSEDYNWGASHCLHMPLVELCSTASRSTCALHSAARRGHSDLPLPHER